MKRFILLLSFVFLFSSSWAIQPRNHYVSLRTDFGVCVIKLYNETPLHRDNFLKLVKDKFYNGLLFHRVIENFMIQGGDPSSIHAKKGELLGNGSVDYTIPAEFRDSLFHKKGALAAARNNNPEKASSGCQFYLVQGTIFTDAGLDSLEEFRIGRKIPEYQREVYETIGGVPYLDQNYTVFGEIVDGMDVLDKIASLPTDPNDRPILDQAMEITELTRRQSRQLERQLRGEDPPMSWLLNLFKKR